MWLLFPQKQFNGAVREEWEKFQGTPQEHGRMVLLLSICISLTRRQSSPWIPD